MNKLKIGDHMATSMGKWSKNDTHIHRVIGFLELPGIGKIEKTEFVGCYDPKMWKLSKLMPGGMRIAFKK